MKLVPAILVGVLSLALAQPAQAQEKDRLKKFREWESWIVLEEEDSPEPPLLRLEVGLLAYFEVRTSLRADRHGVIGSELDDLEENQGLDAGGAAPWIEFSLGGKVRGGADGSWFVRGGDLELQTDQVVFDGIELARPGDYVRAEFEFLSLSGFVEWDALYGKTYRIGLLGGLRYFRMDFDMEGVRATLQPHSIKVRTRGELVSPFFGGLVELSPFPYLNVFTRVQFMSWSWEQVNLKDGRYFQFRLGFQINPVPGVVSVGLEYRFLRVRAVAATSNSGTGRRLEGAINANGLAFSVTLAF